MTYENPLQALRHLMKQEAIEALWVPHGDLHQNEYVPACYQRLKWLTGFTGSAGLALVTQTQAFLFIDGRYTLQAPQEVEGDLWTFRSFKRETIQDVIKENALTSIHYDAWLMTVSDYDYWCSWGKRCNIQFHSLKHSLIDQLWTSRPSLPQYPIVEYPLCYAGESSLSKRQRLAQKIQQAQAQWALFTKPESIAWLLNVRGQDIPTTPVFLSFAALHHTGHVILWVDSSKVAFDREDVTLYPYDPHHITTVFPEKTRVLIDPTATPVYLHDAFKEKGVDISFETDLTLLPKAIKNKTEQENALSIHIIDAVAIVRCLMWLEDTWPYTPLTELDVVKQLHTFRCESPLFKGDSFDTIAATGPHGAIVHYKPTIQSNRRLTEGDLFLLDSGGQYLGGTTDVTRTLPLGPTTLAQRQAFTRVLKGHIRLAQACFPTTTTGAQLDALARYDLWQEGQDYAHGTGHGVGNYLSVHEGPQSLSPLSKCTLHAGMILSNEPGYYEPHGFGIRIENLMMVEKSVHKDFLVLKPLTQVPIDNRLVEKEMLTNHEIKWLQDYHKTIYDSLVVHNPTLGPFLTRHCFIY